MFAAEVYEFPMASPNDVVEPLRALFDTDALRADEVVAVSAKTEGKGRVNDREPRQC